MAKTERADDLKRWALIGLGVVVFAVRANRAREVYLEEVTSGPRPIEAVGTAVAAFVGLV
jgi:ribosomal silencing factor RsfS